MRTLKKVLALSLVFAMAFTLMAGAAYKDEDSIDSSLRNDITLLEALGVFQGDENGNFNPTANVTRAEAAKMIYVLKNNGVDDKAVAFQGVATFSDVPVGHWAEGYVNYCANLGIMAGWTENGQKVFNPNGNVTGVELTKMLLCLVGYKADVQGYTNNNSWQTNVLLDGANAGITTNYTPSVYAAAPRQWTARLMVNAINAPFVTYNRGEIMYGTLDNPTASYGLNYLRLGIAEGTLTATNAVRTSGGADTDKDGNLTGTVSEGNVSSALRGTNQDEVTVFVEKLNNSDEWNPKSVNYEVNVDNALLGQKVKVYYRQASMTDTTPRDVFAVLADNSEKVVNTTVDKITFSSSNPHQMTVEGEGSMTYSKNHPVVLYVDYAAAAKNGEDAWTFNDGKDKNETIYEKYLDVKSSAPAKVIYDKEGYVTAIYISSAPIYAIVDDIDAENGVFRLSDAQSGRVTLKDLNNKDISFTRSDSDNFADYLNIDSSVADEDVVKITKNFSTGELKYDVTVLEPISATASSFTTKDDNYDTITVDGTAYELDIYAMGNYSWATTLGAAQHDNFYVDGSYVVYSTGESDAANINNLAFVYDAGLSKDSFENYTYRVKVLLADGTRGTYVLNQNSGAGDIDVTSVEALKQALKLDTSEGVVYTYSLRDNTITLRGIDADGSAVSTVADYFTATTPITYTVDNDIAKVGNTSFATNDSSYFFVVNNDPKADEEDKYAVVKASELTKDITANNTDKLYNTATNTTYVAQNVGGFNTLLAGVMVLNDMPGAAVADYYFVNGTASASYTANADGQYEITLPVVTADGENTDLVFKFDDDGDLPTATTKISSLDGKIVEVELNADGSVDVDATDHYGLTAIKANDKDAKSDWYVGQLISVNSNRTQATIGDTIYTINADAKFFVIDNNGTSAANFVSVDEIVPDKNIEGKVHNAVYLLNDEDEIVAIFTENAAEDLCEIIDTNTDHTTTVTPPATEESPEEATEVTE